MALFTTKGCSFVPDGKAEDSCNYHDVGYKDVWVLRQNYDLEFLKNMLSDGVWKPKAYLYYYGVRILGRLFV